MRLIDKDVLIDWIDCEKLSECLANDDLCGDIVIREVLRFVIDMPEIKVSENDK